MSDSEPPLDSFPVRHRDETPGESQSQGREYIILHNHERPCGPAQQLKNYRVQRLGADIPPRAEFRRFCKACSWRPTYYALRKALMRTPIQYRRE